MSELFDLVRCLGSDADGSTLAVGILLRVTLILLVASLFALVLRRASAALRHWVWTLSLVGALLVPVVYGVFPAWQWAVLPRRQAAAAPVIPLAADVSSEAPIQPPHSPSLIEVPTFESFDVAPKPASAGSFEESTLADEPIVERSAPPASVSSTWSWTVALAVVWASGTAVGLVWLAIGVAAAWHVARRARPVADAGWCRLLRQLRAACGIRRPVAVRECPRVSVPMTWGLRRPVILVPADSSEWSDATKRSVLLHELGHIRRGDCLMYLVSRLACAVYWFHPLAWLAARQSRKTSEQAADDVVLSSNIAPPDYANHLVGIAAQARGSYLFGHVALPMASPSDLETRVRAILDSQRNHRSLKRKTCYALVVLAGMIVVPCALLQLGYAEDKPPREQAVAEQNDSVAGEKVESTEEDVELAGADGAKTDATKTVAISGVVVDRDGVAVIGIPVRALTREAEQPKIRSDGQGRFALRVGRGHVRGLSILARSTDGKRQGYSEFDWDIDHDEPIPPIRLAVSPARPIDVEVVDRLGKPVPGATVEATANSSVLAGGRSDEHGKVALLVPAEAPLQYLYALKSGLGLDYLPIPGDDRATTGDLPRPPDLSRRVTLKLAGATTVKIKLVDPEGQPIEGIEVRPWYFQKPEWGPGDNLNIGGIETFKANSDAAGVAEFDWIPLWNEQTVIFWPVGGFWHKGGERWTSDRISWNPRRDPKKITATLQRTVPVRGQVRHADGRPAADILVQAKGAGKSIDAFHGQAWTDREGRFEIRVAPDQVYIVGIVDSHQVAAAKGGIAVQPDTPVENLDFELLRSPTRLHGKVTLGPDEKPWANQAVILSQRNPDQESRFPSIIRRARTDAEGRYAFPVGPGQYEIWVDSPGKRSFTVTDQEELVQDFNIPRAPRGPITVHVVDTSDPPRPVPGAKVVGVSVSNMGHGNLEATTNHEGWFRVERWRDTMLLAARSADGKLAGSVSITPEHTEVYINVEPTGTAKGRVIDAATGEPVANREIRYEVFYRYEDPSTAGSSYLIGVTQTDEAGRFEITELTPGLEYQLTMPFQEEMPHFDRLAKVTVKSGQTVDLGEVRFRGVMRPGELLDVALANRDPLDKRLTELAEEGLSRGKRVLIMFWTDEARQNLADLYSFERFTDYRAISSRVESKEMEKAKNSHSQKWGLERSDMSWPLFCILETDGRPLVVKDTRDFVKDGKVDVTLLVDFLKEHALKSSDGGKAAPEARENAATTEGVDSASKPRATETEPAEPPPALLSAFGKVLDPDGKPVAGAMVYLREWSTYRISQEPYERNPNDILATTKTDAQGTFRFENVPAKPLNEQWLKSNPWDVVVVAEPYAMAWRHLLMARPSEPLMITLTPEARLTGRLIDQQGRPVEDAKVVVFDITSLGHASYYHHSRHSDRDSIDLQYSRLSPGAKTDADGTVTIAGLPRNRLIGLHIVHDDFRREFLYAATTGEPQPSINFPGHDKEGKLKVRSKKVFSEAFSAVLEPPLPRVTGRVLAADTKKPLPGIIVMVLQALETMTDQEGCFTIDELGDPPCRLIVSAPTEEDYLGRFVHVDLARDKRDTQIDIELPRGEILSGKVVDKQTGKGVEGVNVGFETGFDVNTATTDGTLARGDKTDGEGRFRLLVPPGKGKVKISGPVPGFNPPIRHRPEDIEGFFQEVDVVAGQTTTDVTFTIRRGNPTISPEYTTQTVKGRVVDPDGRPAAGAEVGPLFWFRENPWMQRTGRTNQDGRFRFESQKGVFADDIVVALDRNRRLRGYSRLLGAFETGAHGDPIEIRLTPTGVVTGRVLAKDGPVHGATVQITRSGRPIDIATTEADGSFRFPYVEADREFEVRVHSDMYVNLDPRAHQVSVTSGGTATVEPFSLIRLDRWVAGIVVDPDGNPMAGVMVRAKMLSGGPLYDAVAQKPTGTDGRFTVRGVPNVPVMLEASIRIPEDPDDSRRYRYAQTKAEPGQMDVRIVLDPRLASRND